MPTQRAAEHQYQTHALSHFANGCSGKIPVKGEWTRGLCPVCLRWVHPNDLTRDHAPPQAGQTMLGLPHLEILVCRECNGSAGRSYECAADQVRRSTRVPWPFCEVHEQCRQSLDSGLFIPSEGSDLIVAELKAAYLIAFACLGHSWVLTARLDGVRRTIRTGEIIHAAADIDLGCLRDGELTQRSLVHVGNPVPAVVVVGESVQVALPSHHTPAQGLRDVLWPRDRSLPWMRRVSLQGETIPWPSQFVRPGGTPKKAWDSGALFHLDRCDNPRNDSLRTPIGESLLRRAA